MSSSPVKATSPTAERAWAILVPLCFAALAGVFLMDPWPFKSPLAPAVPMPSWAPSKQTVRTPKLAPYIELAGRRYACHTCHDKFIFSEDPPLAMHGDIVLAHGINDRCLNCHHATNRDVFAGNREEEIPYDKPQLLCAKCHGPVYRDWINRSHGRTNGYWDQSRGVAERRLCIECHDPHNPPFPPFPPAPPPNTIRMGDQDFEHQETGVSNPLQQPHTVPGSEAPETHDGASAGASSRAEHGQEKP